MAVIEPTPAAAFTAMHATTQRKTRRDVSALPETRGIACGSSEDCARKSLIYIRRVAVLCRIE